MGSSDTYRCVKCKLPVHNICMDLSRSEQKAIKDSKKQMVYFCNRCDADSRILILEMKNSINELVSRCNKYDKLEASLSQLNNKLNEIESRLAAARDNKGEDDAFNETALNEINERIKRKKNLIIFGLAESNSQSSQERITDDKAEIQKICSGDCLELVNTWRSHRLGRNVVPGRPRPIKIICRSEEDAQQLLNSLISANKNKQTTVSVTRDKTKIQQDYYKKLKDELRQRQVSGENNIVIRNFNGLPKIVKRSENIRGTGQATQ